MLLAVGVPMLIWPRVFAGRPGRKMRRLAQLRAGAEEIYFEERRELEAYPSLRPHSKSSVRLWGCLVTVVGIGALILGR